MGFFKKLSVSLSYFTDKKKTRIKYKLMRQKLFVLPTGIVKYTLYITKLQIQIKIMLKSIAKYWTSDNQGR